MLARDIPEGRNGTCPETLSTSFHDAPSTSARSGFPKALIDLKGALVANCAALPPESPGSKWPKTTLGALRDGVRLTPEQLQQLNAICKCVHNVARIHDLLCAGAINAICKCNLRPAFLWCKQILCTVCKSTQMRLYAFCLLSRCCNA